MVTIYSEGNVAGAVYTPSVEMEPYFAEPPTVPFTSHLSSDGDIAGIVANWQVCFRCSEIAFGCKVYALVAAPAADASSCDCAWPFATTAASRKTMVSNVEREER
jgi:hypothetical protein